MAAAKMGDHGLTKMLISAKGDVKLLDKVNYELVPFPAVSFEIFFIDFMKTS